MRSLLETSGSTSTSKIEIAVDRNGLDAIVRLKGLIDVDSSPDVRDRLQAILSSNPMPADAALKNCSLTRVVVTSF